MSVVTMDTRAVRPVLGSPSDLAELLDVPFTAEQRDAITAPLEPGVIVAGAGSGKTTVMAARVVWLVGSGAVAPGEVLGLTFTNKAAGELAQRVHRSLLRAGLAGPSLSPVPDDSAGAEDGEPTVSTYHAFAQRLLADHALRIGVEPRARLLADATRFQLAYRTLCRAEGPYAHLTKPVRMLVADLVSLEGELNEHLVSTEALREHDRAVLAEIADLAKAPKDVATAAEVAHRRLELADLVDEYRAAKRARDAVDFGDQVALAARLGEERPEVGVIERDRFRVVLLDEYQDTSVAQRRMLTALFGHGHPVTAVGDPCQAIYGWRGASVANLDEFGEHFRRADGRVAAHYTLRENRRSGGRLLRLANTVAAPLRALHDVAALAPAPGREDDGETACALLPTYAEEIAWSADQVHAAVHEDGVNPGDIAVLVRARSDFPAVYAALASRDLPVEVVGLGGLIALPEVADVVATLEVLEDPTANAALVRLLTGPRWRIGPRDLVLLGRRARQLVRVGPGAQPPEGLDGVESGAAAGDVDAALEDTALEDAVAGVDPTEVTALSDALDSPGRAVPYSAQARERFTRFAGELRELRRHLGEPLLDLLHRVIATTGLDVELAASPQAVAAGRRESLATFCDHAASFADLDGDTSVGAFLGFLRAADEYERGLDTSTPTAGDSVKLLTAHKAKGLEWDVVVVPDVTANVFPSSQGRPRWTSQGQVLPFGLRGDADSLPAVPDWSAKGLKQFGADCRAHADLEERRLGYVAYTRPRMRLVVSGHWWGPTQKRRRGPSPFLEEVRAHCAAGYGRVHAWAAEPDEGATNPALDQRESHGWPHPLDPEALAVRQDAAQRVLDAMDGARHDAAAPMLPGMPDDGGLDGDEAALVSSWDADADALLDEIRRSRRVEHTVTLPTGLSASQLVRLARDPQGLAQDLARPMPRPPAPHARRGTRFHAWVEARTAQQPLFGTDDLLAAEDVHEAYVQDESELEALKQAFDRGPYAHRVPVAVEAPFQLVVAGRVLRGRIDAVYDDGDGYEVVDWKTGSRPADPLQLAVYRLAWADVAGVDPSCVFAAFVYVAEGRVVRPPDLPDREALARLLRG
ncbi:MAG: UvrD-helicase domain-containing protein [Actinomycetes bacterium]